MYHFNHIWVYRSLALSTFTLLCNHPSPECSSSSQTETLPLTQRFPISPFPQAPAAILLLSLSMDLTALATSHTWNHTIRVLLGLHNVHPGMRSSGTPMLSHVSELHSFQRLHSVLCVEGKVCAGRLISSFWKMSFLRMLHYKSKPKYPFSHPVLRHIPAINNLEGFT